MAPTRERPVLRLRGDDGGPEVAPQTPGLLWHPGACLQVLQCPDGVTEATLHILGSDVSVIPFS